MPHRLTSAKRLVIKIGSTLLVDPKQGALRRTWLEGVAEDVAACRARGQEVVIVSSGAFQPGTAECPLFRITTPCALNSPPMGPGWKTGLWF